MRMRDVVRFAGGNMSCIMYVGFPPESGSIAGFL